MDAPITTTKATDPSGNIYGKAGRCTGRCYTTTTEGMILAVCPRYDYDRETKLEKCLEDCED